MTAVVAVFAVSVVVFVVAAVVVIHQQEIQMEYRHPLA